MLLNIKHISQYVYDDPVAYALQRIKLTPRNSQCQKVHNWEIDCHGASREVVYHDGFGNLTELVRHERNARDVTITVSGSVETFDRSGVEGPDTGGTPLWTWLRCTPLTTAGDGIRALAGELDGNAPRLELLHLLLARIHQRISFTIGATDSNTDAESALSAGHGVCQDHSHVFVSTARLLGIPARYVSGYLMLDGTTNQAASHAWAEGFVDGVGWVGFDAANGVSPDERYVRLAKGLDYGSAAPVTGIRHGSGGEQLEVAINVEQ
jgi:transglutaminase-like putative cysteine protease